MTETRLKGNVDADWQLKRLEQLFLTMLDRMTLECRRLGPVWADEFAFFSARDAAQRQ